MSLFLAGLLVRGGVLTPEAVEEALQRQTRQGGSLDTNLLELGVVAEETLTIYLSRASGLPVAPRGSLEAPAAAMRNLLPLRLAERHAVVPFANEEREVHLACAHPMEATHLDEMALLLSQRIVAYVAPEFRIRRAIALLYGEPIPPRFEDLVDRLKVGAVGRGEVSTEEGATPGPGFGMRGPAGAREGNSGPAPAHAPAAERWVQDPSPVRASVAAPAPQADPSGVRMVPEPSPGEASAPAPARIREVSGGPRLVVPSGSGGGLREKPADGPSPAAPAPLTEVSPGPTLAVTPGPISDAHPPAGGRQAAAPPQEMSAGAAPGTPPEPTAGAPAPSGDELQGESAPTPESGGAKGLSARTGPRARSSMKLSMEEALAWLATTTDRDEALDVLLRFAGSHFSFVASLLVQGRQLLGRDALAEAPDAAERVKTLSFSLDEPSVLQMVVETGGRYWGPLAEHDPARGLIADLGRPPPCAVLVQPITIGQRSVALLIAENGDDVLTSNRADLVMQVAQAVGRKLEQLIHARKSAAAAPQSAAGTPPPKTGAPHSNAGTPHSAADSPHFAAAAAAAATAGSSSADLSLGSEAPSRTIESWTMGPGAAGSGRSDRRISPRAPKAAGEDARASTSASPDQLPIGSKGVERLLASRSEEELRVAIAALEPLGSLAAALLISLLPGEAGRRGRGLSGVHRVVSALELLGEAALPALRQAAASPSPLIRYEVARLIRRCRQEVLDPTLIVLASDEDPKVAAAAQGQG